MTARFVTAKEETSASLICKQSLLYNKYLSLRIRLPLQLAGKIFTEIVSTNPTFVTALEDQYIKQAFKAFTALAL